MTWIVHITDPAIALQLNPYFAALDAVRVADADAIPAHLRDDAAVRVSDVRADEVDVYIIGCDWTMTVDWEPDDMRANADRIVAVVADPYSYYSYAGDLPDLTPARVHEWFDFDDKPVDLEQVETRELTAEVEQ